MAVSTEDSATQAAMAKDAGLEFTLLSDAGRELITALGLRHEDAVPFLEGAVARPAVLIVTGGEIHKRYATDNWRVRQDGGALVAELATLR